MPTLRLIKSIIDKLPLTENGQCFYRDTELTGFGLCVGTQSKTFFVESRLNRRNVRQTLGRYPIMPLEQARHVAMQRLAALMQGVNPVAADKAKRAREMTLDEAFDSYFEAKPNLAKPTVDGYRRSQKLYLRDWLKIPLREITREMVLTKHRLISRENGGITANNALRHFRLVYNFVASVQDEFQPNPVQVLTRTRAWAPQRRRRTLVAAHQLPMWWQAVQAEEPHARDFLTVALFTGMRRSEIARLKWEYIDFAGKTLHIPKTKTVIR